MVLSAYRSPPVGHAALAATRARAYTRAACKAFNRAENHFKTRDSDGYLRPGQKRSHGSASKLLNWTKLWPILGELPHSIFPIFGPPVGGVRGCEEGGRERASASPLLLPKPVTAASLRLHGPMGSRIIRYCHGAAALRMRLARTCFR